MRLREEDVIDYLAGRPWGEKVLMHWPRFLDPWHWQYIFSDLGDLPWREQLGESKWTRIKCRMRGHPMGEVYFNPGGDEPNHDCKGCGEDLG